MPNRLRQLRLSSGLMVDDVALAVDRCVRTVYRHEEEDVEAPEQLWEVYAMVYNKPINYIRGN